MKKFILIVSIILVLTSCRKRSSVFSFAGVWEITKVEQRSYVGDSTLIDITLSSDTLGWFALQNTDEMNASGNNFRAKIEINFVSLSGLSTDYTSVWDMDEHVSDRVQFNKIMFTRERIIGGEKWSWMTYTSSGANYSRETIFVKRQ